jgi:hypothetical protein
MEKEIKQIRLPIINYYMKVIYRLAKQGRNDYYTYLITPLSKWTDSLYNDDLAMIKSKIAQKKTNKDLSYIGSLYKRALVVSASPNQFDLAEPGNIALEFLKDMQRFARVANTQEALEFVNLLGTPFKRYEEYEYKITNQKFIEEINSADPEKVKALIQSRESKNAVAVKEKQLSDMLLRKIEQGIKEQGISHIKRSVIIYFLRIATANNPILHKDIDPLLHRIESFNKGFTKDVLDTSAVLIYHEIVNAIKTKQLKKAITFISKYTVLFRGDPSTPNHYEVDTFEKQFFDLVEKRNLWDSL